MHGHPCFVIVTACHYLVTTLRTYHSNLLHLCSVLDLRKVLTEMGEVVDESQLRELIAEVDLNKNNTIEEDEFLQVRTNTHRW